MDARDKKAIATIERAAAALSGNVPRRLGAALRRYDAARDESNAMERELDARCKALRANLAVEVRRILGRYVETTHLDARMLIAHDTRPEKCKPWFEVHFFVTHKTREVHHPCFRVNLTPIRANAVFAQLYALRAAADAYTKTMDKLMPEPAPAA